MTRLAYDSYGNPIQGIIPGTTQPVSYDSSTATTSAFAANTTIIRIVSTTATNYVIAASPAATNNDVYLPAGTVEYVGILKGSSMKIAFIKANGGTAGVAYVTEGAG